MDRKEVTSRRLCGRIGDKMISMRLSDKVINRVKVQCGRRGNEPKGVTSLERGSEPKGWVDGWS